MIFPKIDSFTVERSAELGEDFNFVNGQHVVQGNGRLSIANNRTNIENWCRKVILTMLGLYEVYTKDETEGFGISVYDKLGTKEKAYWVSEFKREATEQLLRHNCIEQVKDFKAEFVRRDIIISFTVVCIDGILNTQGVENEMIYDNSSGSSYDPLRDIVIQLQTRLDMLQARMDELNPIPIPDVERLWNG